MQQDDSLQNILLEEELKILNKPQQVSHKWADMVSNPSIWSNQHSSRNQNNTFADPNKHRFNHYADKQLYHLVVAEEFDFAKIASLLNYIFREQRTKFTEASCRERWEELYILRNNQQEVRVKRMQDKRASSVSTFSDPFCLYNLQEMLDKLQKTQKQRESEHQNAEIAKPQGNGYNIFKNSIRQIDDIQGYKKRQKQMMNALNQAQDPTHAIHDKLMHFSPYYDRLNEFEVKQEELTQQKMREIMSVPIQMENLELQLKVKDMNESSQNWKPKRNKRQEQKMAQEEHRYEIEQDWDEYQSD